MAPQRPSASAIWSWTIPLRRLRAQRRRFANLSFLAAGVAFGTTLYLVISRPGRLLDPTFVPLLLGLVGVLVALFLLGTYAEAEVEKIEAEIAELEAEASRRFDLRR